MGWISGQGSNFDKSSFYHRKSFLDAGGSGDVYLEEDIRSKEMVAVKYIPRDRINRHVKREILNFTLCQHPKIISFREVKRLRRTNSLRAQQARFYFCKHNAWTLQVFLTKDYLAISMEYADGGNLLDYINNNGPLPESRAKRFWQQVRRGATGVYREKLYDGQTLAKGFYTDLRRRRPLSLPKYYPPGRKA